MTSRRTEPLRVLLVEDDEDDYVVTRDLLRDQSRARVELDWCADYASALATIRQQRHDVYLVDFRLGARTGLDLIREAFAARPRAPVLVLTGQSDYEIDLEASELGVTDYLVKQQLDASTLERSIRYAVGQQRAVAELRRSEERYELAVRAANDGLWDWDLVRDRIYLSPRWHSLLGHPERSGEESPVAWFELVHDEDRTQVRDAIAAHLAGETQLLEVEHRMRHADGTWRWTLSRGLAIRDEDGRATRMAGSLSDVTERRSAERRLQHDALHDALTGLPNRALFMDRLDHALRRGARDGRPTCAVLFLDVDRFKLVNDGLGHMAGDELLRLLSARVESAVRPGDTVARLGGDEFAILLDEIEDDEQPLLVAERIQRCIGQELVLDGRTLRVTASIGVALAGDATAAAELLRNADIAMYDGKRRGGGLSETFDESMRRRRVDRLAREHEVRRAVEDRLLQVHYQPIVELASGRIRALEALARWPEDWSPVSPAEFVPVAEETGMIGALGLHVLRSALDALVELRRAHRLAEDVSVSVNVSGRQLVDPRLPDQISAALSTAGLPPQALTLEITESMLVQESVQLHDLVSRVCASGVGLHLDDFGTGYSSLAALQQFPVNALKIDRSFINSDAPTSDVIVRSTITLAHNLGMRVIAEGIETDQQLAHLTELGCDYGQGYLFSRPVSVEASQALLDGWTADVSATR